MKSPMISFTFRKEGKKSVHNKISNILTALKRDESSVKIAIQTASIFIFRWQIFDKIFSNRHCCNMLFFSIRAFHTGHRGTRWRRADLTHPENSHDLPVLSHSRRNRTIDHSPNKSLSISLPQNSPSSPQTHLTMNFTGNSVQFLLHLASPSIEITLSSNTWNVWYLTKGRAKVSQDHLAVIVPARAFTFDDEATRFGRPIRFLWFLSGRSNFARRAFLPTEQKTLFPYTGITMPGYSTRAITRFLPSSVSLFLVIV